jgi:hypothetical protein
MGPISSDNIFFNYTIEPHGKLIEKLITQNNARHDLVSPRLTTIINNAKIANIETSTSLQQLLDLLYALEEANKAYVLHLPAPKKIESQNELNQHIKSLRQSEKDFEDNLETNWAIYLNAAQLAELLLVKFPLSDSVKEEIELLARSVTLAIKFVKKETFTEQEIEEARQIATKINTNIENDNISSIRQEKWSDILRFVGILILSVCLASMFLLASFTFPLPVLQALLIGLPLAITMPIGFACSVALIEKGAQMKSDTHRTNTLNNIRTMFYPKVCNKVRETVPSEKENDLTPIVSASL